MDSSSPHLSVSSREPLLAETKKIGSESTSLPPSSLPSTSVNCSGMFQPVPQSAESTLNAAQVRELRLLINAGAYEVSRTFATEASITRAGFYNTLGSLSFISGATSMLLHVSTPVTGMLYAISCLFCCKQYRENQYTNTIRNRSR